MREKLFRYALSFLVAVAVLMLSVVPYSASAAENLVIDGVLEAAGDIPKMLFILHRDPNGPPLTYEDPLLGGETAINWAYYDTGASGILLSYETASQMGIAVETNSVFVDVGVGGEDYFYVSEPLYISIKPYSLDLGDFEFFGTLEEEDLSGFEPAGQFRVQITQTQADELIGPIDLMGVPTMAGRVIVLDANASNIPPDDNEFALPGFFNAYPYSPQHPNIPPSDFQIPLRFEKYIQPDNPLNVPPLPVLAYNPVIDNITIKHGSQNSTGTWLLDTGGMVSLISIQQAQMLGLVDANGNPLVETAFSVAIGGVGGIVEIPGFSIDELSVPTINGFKLIYKNAMVAVHDIGYYDVQRDQYLIVDGVFGMNNVSLSAHYADGWPEDFRNTIFDKIIIDMPAGLMGIKVLPEYLSELPRCGDANHPYPPGDINKDCKVNISDQQMIVLKWLDEGCAVGNNYCSGADIDQSGSVNFADIAKLADDWGENSFQSGCGGADMPWTAGDLNRNCVIDIGDVEIFVLEWLNDCDELNWRCRGADIDRSSTVNLSDWGRMKSAKKQ